MQRRGKPWAALLCGALFAQGAAAQAAEADVLLATELRRGVAAVGPGASDRPAIRAEQQARAVSEAFRTGAALAAWINAAETLDFDLRTPSGDGDDSAAIRQDCREEAVALADLEASRQALRLTPKQVLDAAGVTNAGVLAGWLARQAQAPAGCR